MAKPDLMDRVVNLAKRRGLVFPSREIYGGFRSTWDYGPLGVLLKRNVKDAWWRSMVQLRDDIVGLDAAILMAPKVWEASGHVATFTDPLVDCRNCNERFRADQLPESGACPNCGAKDTLHRGPPVQPDVQDATSARWRTTPSVAYLRPETAQGIFVNFKNVQTTTRKKPPFGIAQIGKSFRNEITPGNFIFRTREFEQMEMEYFVPPDEGDEVVRVLGARSGCSGTSTSASPSDQLRLRPHETEELSHYSAGTADVEFMYPWGWGELEGIANRTDYDLTQHAKFSGQDLTYFDQENDRRYVPHVIEPAAGADRATLAFLLAAYDEEEVPDAKGGTEKRIVLRLDPRLAPIKVAVLPLSKNEKLVPAGRRDRRRTLRPHFMIDVDDAGSIGRRYRRQDEVGTPLCVTVDFDSLDDDAVTVRDRDTMAAAAHRDRRALLPAAAAERLGVASTDGSTTARGTRCSASSRAPPRATSRPPTSTRSTPRPVAANADEARQVRRAWQVLSDPMQRQRYDEAIGVAPPARSSRSTQRRRSTRRRDRRRRRRCDDDDDDVEVVDDDEPGASRQAVDDDETADVPRAADARSRASPRR